MPGSTDSLTVADVSQCLRLLNMEAPVTTFKNHQVDDGLLCALTEKVLCDDFRLTPFNASKLPKVRDLALSRDRENVIYEWMSQERQNGRLVSGGEWMSTRNVCLYVATTSFYREVFELTTSHCDSVNKLRNYSAFNSCPT